MAWRCSGRTNMELISNLTKHGIITTDRVADAMCLVDRANFVQKRFQAYEDAPQSIDHGATISAPHMHAHALENMLPFLHPGATVLDVGSGSGYLCAALHHLVSPSEPGAPQGKVVGIDHIPELVERSKSNLITDGLGPALDEGRILLVTGDGRQGYPDTGPYDAIHVGAASERLPETLINQLKAPGIMFIPVGTYNQAIWQIEKDAMGKVTKQELMGVMVSVNYYPRAFDPIQFYDLTLGH
ncbi:protein-L-isoaspartate O-methyltransferase [Butyriboletus roseoflavus]|nr:protein-L-isoaspartate O-methyltransferase [Butyriboletus roseoflavus]